MGKNIDTYNVRCTYEPHLCRVNLCDISLVHNTFHRAIFTLLVCSRAHCVYVYAALMHDLSLTLSISIYICCFLSHCRRTLVVVVVFLVFLVFLFLLSCSISFLNLPMNVYQVCTNAFRSNEARRKPENCFVRTLFCYLIVITTGEAIAHLSHLLLLLIFVFFLQFFLLIFILFFLYKYIHIFYTNTSIFIVFILSDVPM